MKALTFTFLLFAGFFLFTCKKGGSPTIPDNTLTGKWKLSESLADPGDGSGKWMPVAAALSSRYVQFDGNGKLEGTAFPNDVSYVVKDSITLTFISKDNVQQNYRYSIENGSLDMSPDGPIRCYEACGTRYVRVK